LPKKEIGVKFREEAKAGRGGVGRGSGLKVGGKRERHGGRLGGEQKEGGRASFLLQEKGREIS